MVLQPTTLPCAAWYPHTRIEYSVRRAQYMRESHDLKMKNTMVLKFYDHDQVTDKKAVNGKIFICLSATTDFI
jgi:hypothetical protein